MSQTVANLSESPLLQGSNARGRFHYFASSIAALRQASAALYPRILAGDREAALDFAVLNARIAAVQAFEERLRQEASLEENALHHAVEQKRRDADADRLSGKITGKEHFTILNSEIPAMLSQL